MSRFMRTVLSAFIAAAASCALFAVGPAPAMAADSGAVSSSRSFPKSDIVTRRLLSESTSTDVKKDSDWGGIETLDVPVTKTKAERDAAAARKAAEERERQEREAVQQAVQSASRSAGRSVTVPAPATMPESGRTVNDMVGRALAVQGASYRSSGYVWTGDVSTSSFTCSGLVDFALGRPTNTDWPETLYAQVGGRMTTDAGALQYGDLVFFRYDGRSPGHVGIYLGNGMMVDSAPDGGVAVRSISGDAFMGGGPIL